MPLMLLMPPALLAPLETCWQCCCCPDANRASEVLLAVMQPPFPGDCDALLEDETVDVIVNGESRVPGVLSVVTKGNFKASKEQMMKDRSIVFVHPGPEWVRDPSQHRCCIV